MKKIITPVLFLILFSFTIANNKQDLTITYIGNMGVLISSGDKQILVDALHEYYGDDYLYPPKSLVDKIFFADEPFTSIDIALSTHVHGDHFSPNFAGAFLENNGNANYILTQQSFDSTKSVYKEFMKVEDRLSSSTKYLNNIRNFNFEDFHITSIHLPHVGAERHADIQNSGYVINLNGLKILHVGDANPSPDNFKYKELENLDVAILPIWFLGEAGQKVVETLNPKHIIITHIAPKSVERVKPFADANPKYTAFTELMQVYKHK